MAIPPPTAGSVALITGASSGIGCELARQLAAAGHDCVLVARRTERLETLTDEIRHQCGRLCHVVPCDVSDPAARAELGDRIRELAVTVEVLVLSAGFGIGGPFVDNDAHRLQLMVRTNVEGVVALARSYSPAMVEKGRGAILIVSSVAGNQPMPNITAYAATKAAVTAFGEGLHEELRPHGVTVTTIAPGGVATEFAGVAQGNLDLEPPSPSALMATAEQTATAAIEALAAGRRLVVPGVAVKAVAMSGRYLPRALWFRFSGAMVGPRRSESRRNPA